MLSAPRLGALLLLGSAVVLIQLCLQDTDSGSEKILGLLVSGTSTCLVAVMIGLHIVGQTELVEAHTHVAVTALVFMWLLGTSVMTLSGPFKNTGNGYFGCWLALGASWLLGMHYYPSMREPLDRLTGSGGHVGLLVAGLLLASLTVFVQTIAGCVAPDYEGWCDGNAGWLMSCSGITSIVTLSLLSPNLAESAAPFFPLATIGMFVWWSAGCAVGTFIHPYELTGNGFFGCWGALVATALLVDAVWNLNAASRAEEVTRRLPRPLLLLAIASIVLAFAGYTNDEMTWPFFYGMISFVLCLGVMGMLLVFGPESSSTNMKPFSVLLGTTGFLLVFWLAGALVATFYGPFKVTSNGYFAAWSCLACAWLLAVPYFVSLEAAVDEAAGDYGLELSLVVFCAMALLLQAIVDAVGNNVDVDLNWLAAPLCSVASLVLGCLIARKNDGFAIRYHKYVLVALALLWTAGTVVLTFDSPYFHTGNAYFAIWTAFFTSIMMVIRHFVPGIAMPSAAGGGSTEAPPATTVGRPVSAPSTFE